MRILTILTLLCSAIGALAAPLQTFTLKEYLNRAWTEELVHFPFEVATTAKELHLTDAAGAPLLCQVTDVARANGRVTGNVWTVVTLKALETRQFHLQPGAPKTPPPAGVTLTKTADAWELNNDRVGARLPLWPGKALPCPLTALPPPLAALARGGEMAGLAAGEWAHAGDPLMVTDATTEVLEQGPLRAAVRQSFTLADGRAYSMTVQLAARQDVLRITEDSTIAAPKTAFRLNMRAGLGADQVLWYDTYYESVNAGKNRVLDKFDFEMGERERTLFLLSPWSFWWEKDRAQSAGFTQDLGGAYMVSVQLLRPSRWSPYHWDGFAVNRAPVVIGKDGRLDVLFPLVSLIRKGADGTETLSPLHREWALAVDPAEVMLPDQPVHPFRKRLIKYGEFPLDEVKDYAFDFTPAKPERKSPFLFFTEEEFPRIKAQATDHPIVRDEALKARVAGLEEIQRGGLDNYYLHYWGQGGMANAPTAYLAFDDPRLERALAAGVLGLKQDVLNTFLNRPTRPSLGGYGPWFSDNAVALVRLYDLVAGRGILTAEEEASVRASLVFLAHQLHHPDYWNTDRGLCSANPNMTSSIKLPQALLGLYLDGHPHADTWLKSGEDELKHELAAWISPGGAWVESPGYQSASLDGMFLLAQALKQVRGRDYFADTQFKDLMEYYGFLLTPPDRRFAAQKLPSKSTPMVLPSVGDTFAGFITCYNGWMAKATAQRDPAYSARQQFYWKSQGYYYGSAGRAQGMMLALTDPALPAAAPEDTSKAFPGFGTVMRTSWTDPNASYLAHRTGPNYHHYHADHGSLVYYAKGAPLCTDFGNLYQPARRSESRFHSLVHLGDGDVGQGGVRDFATLRRTADYSFGRTHLGGGTLSERHILFVKSADPLGANYVVMRDRTSAGKAEQPITWSLWCLAKPWVDPNAPQIDDDKLFGGLDDEPMDDAPRDRIHFTGQFGVDLDVHVLSPQHPKLEMEKNWEWTQHIYVWGPFAESMSAGRITKQGHAEDFFTVLYPRAAGQAEAVVTALADGAGAAVTHMEGLDVLLLSPGKAATVTEQGARLSGEVVFARKYANGALRLALLRGNDASASLNGWGIASAGTVAVEIAGTTVTGETDGPAQTVTITAPANSGPAAAQLDGKPLAVKRDKDVLTIAIPEGYHAFTVKF